MKGTALKYIILLATISIAGIFLIQFVFVRYSYQQSENQFTESASVALKEVAWQIMLATGTTANFDSINPVEVINDNTFLVNVGVAFDKEMLRPILDDQLKKHVLYCDYEFAIYNPDAEQMEEATRVTVNGNEAVSPYDFPANEDLTSFFSIHFPNRSAFFNARLSIWYFLTGLLVVVVIFFGYTLSVIIRQRQLSEVQKNFINNLTHELKTPISSIALAAQVINNKSIIHDPKRLFSYAQIILDQNTRLSKNVEKVLSVASLEKSKIYLKHEDISLDDFINQSVTVFSQSSNGQKSTIKTDFHNHNVHVKADKFHFANLINNILENAVKYCETDAVIHIELQKRKNALELSFADNGIGIPKEYRKKIFKKFYRIPTGNVHNVKGFGLGLDYVHKIVKAHHWKIRVEENSNGGSTFTIRIPL